MADDEVRRLSATSATSSTIKGVGFAHAMHPPYAPRKPSTLLLHWTQYWEPQCTLAARHTHDFSYSMRTYRESYDRRTATLLRAGIPWTTVLRQDLDSPLQSGAEFDRALTLAIVRRASRIGRVKGISRTASKSKQKGNEKEMKGK
jgi:hypothetical protein